MVSTTSFLNSGVYRLFGTPFGIKITPPVKHYIILSNKWGAVHIARAGCNVILDWGFWSREERTDVSAYYKNAGIDFEWHYIDISDADWAKNIEARNAAVAAGETTDYAVDGGLLQKILTLFETPIPDEIDVWFTNRR